MYAASCWYILWAGRLCFPTNPRWRACAANWPPMVTASPPWWRLSSQARSSSTSEAQLPRSRKVHKMPNTKKSAQGVTRRRVLMGAGVTMALPWLESLPAFADTTSTGAFPKRFAVLFMGNGVNEDHWSSEGSGAEMKLGKTLSPLEPLKHKINVIHGLFNVAS